MEKLDKAYLAIVRYQRREYDECVLLCSKILEENPYDEAIWSLKTRALTAQVSSKLIFMDLFTAPIKADEVLQSHIVS